MWWLLALATPQDLVAPDPSPLQQSQLVAASYGASTGFVDGRIATAKRTAEGTSRIELVELVADLDPLSLALPFDVTSREGPHERRRWAFAEVGDRGVVVALDDGERALHAISFPSGEPRTRINGVMALWDVAATPTTVEVLAQLGHHVEWITLDATGAVTRRGRVSTAFRRVLTATFASHGVSDRPTAVLLGSPRAAADAFGDSPNWIAFVDRDDRHGRASPVAGLGELVEHQADMHVQRDRLAWPRLAAWDGGGRRLAVVGRPDEEIGYEGYCAVLEFTAGSGWRLTHVHETMLPGHPKSLDDPLWRGGFAHTVLLTPDADGDGAPDLLVASPVDGLVPFVRWISTGTGGVLAEYGRPLATSISESVTADPTGRFVLVSGAIPLRRSERGRTAEAVLIDVSRPTADGFVETLGVWATDASGEVESID